jgi:hypothetical protein
MEKCLLEIPKTSIQATHRPIYARKYATAKYPATRQHVVAGGKYQLWPTVAKVKQKRYLQKRLKKLVVRRNYKKIRIEYLNHKNMVVP